MVVIINICGQLYILKGDVLCVHHNVVIWVLIMIESLWCNDNVLIRSLLIARVRPKYLQLRLLSVLLAHIGRLIVVMDIAPTE